MLRILPVLLILIGSVADSLRIKHIQVPKHAKVGSVAILECRFELSKDKEEHLYSVKWYKDNEEFFRYIPRFKPQIVVHPVDGVHVDLERSSNQRVWLHRVEMKTSGVYRCEVSAEAPAFITDQAEGRLVIIYLPTEGPQITGVIKAEYQVGELLDLNCITAKSFPSAKISWHINESPINNTWVSLPNSLEDSSDRYQNVTAVDNHLYVSQRRLRILVHPTHFRPNGVAKIRCRSTIVENLSSHSISTSLGRLGSTSTTSPPVHKYHSRGGGGERGEAPQQQQQQHHHEHSHNTHHLMVLDDKEEFVLIRALGRRLQPSLAVLAVVCAMRALVWA